jgi:hypothetical protein
VPGKVKRVIVAGESNADRSWFAGEDNAFALELDFMKNVARYTESITGSYDEGFFDVAVNGRGDTAFVGYTTSYYTAYDYGWGYPDTYVYGRDVTAPADFEVGTQIASDIIIRKRLAPDKDGDGIPDSRDNCPSVANADQADSNNDGVGDACTVAPPADTDHDGIVDASDNCPAASNANQSDIDGDGIGDYCDADRDNDGVADLVDNCVAVANPGQENADGDFYGDVCDATPMPPPYSNQLSLVATIPSAASGPGYDALTVAVNETTNTAYVLRGDGSLQAIDGRTNTVAATRAIGPGFMGQLAVNPVTNRVYLTNTGVATLRVLDGTSLADVATMSLDTPAYAVAVNPQTNRVYVSDGDSLAELDGNTDQVIQDIPAQGVNSLLVDVASNRLYFGDSGGGTPSLMDLATYAVTRVPVSYSYGQPSMLGADNRFYWNGEEDTTITVTDLATGAKQRTEWLLKFVMGSLANPVAQRVYAYGYPHDAYKYHLFMLDPAGAVIGRLALPVSQGGPRTGALNTRTGVIYLADSNALYVVRDAGAVPPNTPAGSNVHVDGPVALTSVTFSTVATTGETSMTPIADPSSLNLSMPGGFAISTTSTAYEITTTASVSGPIEVCLVASGMTDAEFATASILHGVAGAWQVEATRRDLATHRLCADVASLSPFAVGKLVDTTAPQIACGQAPAGWQAANVTITCTASDSGSGLASAADASFGLSTSVGAGIETASAVTGSRQVCDRAGNCATAGSIGGITIDRRGPSVQIASPSARRYLLAEVVNSSYACSDNGSGVGSCTGPVASGAAIDTATVGNRTFTVTAADRVGNTTAAQADYTVGYGVKALYDETRAFKAGSAVALQVILVDASGRNVSSPGIAVSARKLTRVEDGWTMPLSLSLPFVAKSSSYGGKVDTGSLSAGTYEVELQAAGDAGVLKVRFILK